MIRRTDTPVEVLVASVIAAGGALVFVLVGLLRWQIEGGASAVRLPVIVALFELLVAAGLMFRIRAAQWVGMALFVLIGLLQLVFVLADSPWWVRIVCGVLSAVHIYGVVVLNTAPVRHYFGGTP